MLIQAYLEDVVGFVQTTSIKWISQQSESREFFGSPVRVTVMFTIYYSLRPFMDHSLVMQRALHNSMKLRAMPFLAAQDSWVVVKCSDKTSS